MLIINRYTHCINDFVLNSFYVYDNVESLYSVDFYVVDIREWFVTVSYVFLYVLCRLQCAGQHGAVRARDETRQL